MEERRITASTVVRQVEAALARSEGLRAEARRLMEAADELENDARSSAISMLGPVHGSAAFDLALLSFRDSSTDQTSTKDDAANDASDAVQIDHSAPSAAPAPAMTLEPESLPVRSATSRAKVATKKQRPSDLVTRYGVSFSRSHLDEAEAVIAEAFKTAATNGASNSYQHHRGKNVWKKQLFEAVLGHALAEISKADETRVQEPEYPRTSSERAGSVLKTESQNFVNPSEPINNDEIPAASRDDDIADAADEDAGAHQEGEDVTLIRSDPLDDDLPGDPPASVASAQSSETQDEVSDPGSSELSQFESHSIPRDRTPGFSGTLQPAPTSLINARNRGLRAPSFLKR